MEKIISIVLGFVGINLDIIFLKYYCKFKMKEDIISWKLIGILQIPILIIIYLTLFPFSYLIIFSILLLAFIICIVLGFYLGYRGKKSATEQIEAEIIDINSIPIYSNSCYENTTMYTLTLKYVVNDVEYINKNLKGFFELDKNMTIGNKIIIKYNPKNPNDITY